MGFRGKERKASPTEEGKEDKEVRADVYRAGDFRSPADTLHKFVAPSHREESA